MAGSRPVTPASPKIDKPKDAEPGVPLYGCEHLQCLMTKSPEVTTNTISHYKILLRVIFDKTPIISQTSKSADRSAATSLTPNYLCLQCPIITTAEDRQRHAKLKAHQFYVDSRIGGLFCHMCGDFIWDPTLEELRIRKMTTGSFASSRKRKRDDLPIEASKEDGKYMSTNTIAAPCGANGLRGIFNMGSTCFMSVILQSFIHNPLLRNFYLSDGHQVELCEQDHCLSCGMDEIFQDFYSQDVTVGYSASKLLSDSWLSQRAAFSSLAGYDEHDAHEFFQFLVEELHRTAQSDQHDLVNGNGSQATTRRSSSCGCIVHQTFYGNLQSNVTCQHCGSVTTSVEPFLDLSLGIESIGKKRAGKGNKLAQKRSNLLTLQRCLDEEYLHSERCEYSCRNCDSPQEARKQLSIKNLPNVLCIQFKRFEHHKDRKEFSKINLKVQFPLQVNMLPYTTRARPPESRDNFQLARFCTYDLLSVVVHIGKLNSGHYISYSRVGNQWFMFDDHKVTLVSESQVLGAEAFLLFYIIRSVA